MSGSEDHESFGTLLSKLDISHVLLETDLKNDKNIHFI